VHTAKEHLPTGIPTSAKQIVHNCRYCALEGAYLHYLTHSTRSRI